MSRITVFTGLVHVAARDSTGRLNGSLNPLGKPDTIMISRCAPLAPTAPHPARPLPRLHP